MRTIKKRFPLIQRHRINRVRFAKEFKNEDFTKWLWSDETTFEIGSRKSKAFQFPGEDLEEVSYKYPTSQMVWSCISSDGPGEIAFIWYRQRSKVSCDSRKPLKQSCKEAVSGRRMEGTLIHILHSVLILILVSIGWCNGTYGKEGENVA